MPLHLIFLVVAIVLFVIDALVWWVPREPTTNWGSRLTPLGLAFFAAAFLVGD